MPRFPRPDVQSRIDEVIADAATAAADRSGLAAWLAAEDARLDEDRASSARALDAARSAVRRARGSGAFFEEVILQVAVALARHAQLDPLPYQLASGERDPEVEDRIQKALRQVRVRRDKGARYGDEVEAMRAYYAACYSPRNGDAGRMLARGELGADVVPSKSPREPVSDPWQLAVLGALRRLSGRGARILFLTYVELVPPHQRFSVAGDGGRPRTRSAPADRHDARLAAEEGRVIDSYGSGGRSAASIAFSVSRGEGGLPAGSSLRSGPAVTAAALVAEHLGEVRDEWDEEKRDEAVRAVAAEIRAARSELRDLLRAVVLDVPPYHVVPPAAEPRPGEDPPEDVACCTGTVLDAGLRRPCRFVTVSGPGSRHPAASWPRCRYCGLPEAPRYGKEREPCPETPAS